MYTLEKYVAVYVSTSDTTWSRKYYETGRMPGLRHKK